MVANADERVKSPVSLFYLAECCPHTPPAQKLSSESKGKKLVVVKGNKNTSECGYVNTRRRKCPEE